MVSTDRTYTYFSLEAAQKGESSVNTKKIMFRNVNTKESANVKYRVLTVHWHVSKC